jgi:hypothetical protein
MYLRMEPTFEDKLRAAVKAGWRALLAEVVFLTAVWFIYLAIVETHWNGWLSLWGPNATWAMVSRITLWAIAVYKLGIWLQAAILLWAWLWSRALRQRRMSTVQREDERIVATGVVATAAAG